MTLKTLLILGATGKVGQQLLAQALAHPAVGRVVAPTRRVLASQDLLGKRLDNPVVDYRALPAAPWWRADACLCALGTTMKQAGSKAAFTEVDHDHVLAAARLARQAGTPCFVLVSSLGANAGSGNFYLKVKGRTEDDLAALGFASLTLVRPSLLDAGPRADGRTGESLGLWVAKALAPVLPARLRVVRADSVARHLLAAALAAAPGRQVLESQDLH